MLATHAEMDIVVAPPAALDSRSETSAEMLTELDDELSPARGLFHGMLLGLLSIVIVAGAVWWAF